MIARPGAFGTGGACEQPRSRARRGRAHRRPIGILAAGGLHCKGPLEPLALDGNPQRATSLSPRLAERRDERDAPHPNPPLAALRHVDGSHTGWRSGPSPLAIVLTTGSATGWDGLALSSLGLGAQARRSWMDHSRIGRSGLHRNRALPVDRLHAASSCFRALARTSILAITRGLATTLPRRLLVRQVSELALDLPCVVAGSRTPVARPRLT